MLGSTVNKILKNFLKYDDVLYNAHMNVVRPEVLSNEHKLEIENLLRNNNTVSLETLVIELKKKIQFICE